MTATFIPTAPTPRGGRIPAGTRTAVAALGAAVLLVRVGSVTGGGAVAAVIARATVLALVEAARWLAGGVPATVTVESVVGGLHALVAVGTLGHLVRERSRHLPGPDERLF